MLFIFVEKFVDFIRNFKTEENGEETFKYVETLVSRLQTLQLH